MQNPTSSSSNHLQECKCSTASTASNKSSSRIANKETENPKDFPPSSSFNHRRRQNHHSHSRSISISLSPTTTAQFFTASQFNNFNETQSEIPLDTFIRASSYSGMTPSPAISFLASLAESTAPPPKLSQPSSACRAKLAIGILLEGRFLLTACMKESNSQGTSCWKARDVQREGKEVVLKIACCSEGGSKEEIASFQREIDIWTRVSPGNAHILPLLGTFWWKIPSASQDDDSEIGGLVAVAPLARSGSLLDWTKAAVKMHQKTLNWKGIFRQIVEAVCWIHSRGIAHNDIKLENVLVDDGEEAEGEEIVIFLADFGLASQWNHHHHSQESQFPPEEAFFCGTLAYLAPEIIDSNRIQRVHDLRCSDCWSLGVLLYALICGVFPFGDGGAENFTVSSEEFAKTRQKIIESSWKPTENEQIDWLLSGLLEKSVEKRWTARELFENLCKQAK